MNKLTTSYLFTSLGHWLTLFITPLIVLKITNSAFLVSIVFALDTLPYIILTPFSGILGDKFNKKRLIQIGELVSLISVIILFLTPFTNSYLYLIILLSFIVSAATAMHHPVFNSIIPELFKSNDFKKVNSSVASIGSLTGIIAPAIIGTFLLTFDYKEAVLGICICYLISFLCISLIKYTYVKIDHKGKNITALLKEGAVFVINHKPLRNFSLLFLLMVFGLQFVMGNLIWIYSNHFHVHNIAYYYIIVGILAIIGAQILARFIVDRFKTNLIIKIASLIIAILMTLQLIIPNSPLLFALIIGCISATNMVIVVTFFTYRQKSVPANILARVISITRLISFSAGPPGALLGGYILSKTANVNIIFLIASICLFLAFLFFAFLSKDSDIDASCKK